MVAERSYFGSSNYANYFFAHWMTDTPLAVARHSCVVTAANQKAMFPASATVRTTAAMTKLTTTKTSFSSKVLYLTRNFIDISVPEVKLSVFLHGCTWIQVSYVSQAGTRACMVAIYFRLCTVAIYFRL